MKCILMNKNTRIALLEYNTKYNAIEEVYEIYNIEYAPLSVYNATKNKELNIATEELLNKAYALSLSDQYWIKEQESKVEWKDINFFQNKFKYKGYLQASLSSTSGEHINPPELMSPNNTTDGMLQK